MAAIGIWRKKWKTLRGFPRYALRSPTAPSPCRKELG